jgi:hypothetical protein
VRFDYSRNLESSPYFGDRYAQDVEPAGRYVVTYTIEPEHRLPNHEYGTMRLENPIVLASVWPADGDYGGKEGWKHRLSAAFGGKTGLALTRALLAAGHDGVVTVTMPASWSRQGPYLSEIVDLRSMPRVQAPSWSRPRGSRNTQPSLAVTRAGWPWPTSYRMLHATTGLRAIAADRFRVRSQGLASALGGGTSEAVSFTLSRPIVDAVLVGLVTLRRGARGELSLHDLWQAFARECPKGTAELRTKGDPDRNPVHHRYMDQGLFREQKYMGSRLPPGAIAEDEGWLGAQGVRYHRAWWRKPVTRQEKAEARERRLNAFYQLYNALTAYGSGHDECYWPSFWGTDMEALARVDERDLGVITATSQIDRICLKAGGALQLGYLDRPTAHRWSAFLDRVGRDCRDAVDMDRSYRQRGRQRPLAPMFVGYNSPSDHRVGPWHFVETGTAAPDSAMVYMDSMFEVRVYDPTKLTLVETQPASTYLAQRGLAGRVSAPKASDQTLPPGQPTPGSVVRQEAR